MEALAKQFGLPTYDGTKDVKEFIKAFRLQALVFSWSEDKQCQCIQYLLKGKAERLFEALPAGDEKKIESIFMCLQRGCIVPQEVLLDRFFERKPKADELLSTFAITIQALLFKAMPDLATSDRNILLRRQLGQFMPEHLRALVHFNTQKTWDELMTAIDQSMPHAVACRPIADDADALGGTASSIKIEPVDINAISSSRPQFNGTCRYCKEPGHMVINCQQAKSATARKERERLASSRSFGKHVHYENENEHKPSYRANRHENDSRSRPTQSNTYNQYKNIGSNRFNDKNCNALELENDAENEEETDE